MKPLKPSIGFIALLLLCLGGFKPLLAQEAPCPGQKSSVLSCALSWIIPSLGQYYNGQPVKGAIIDGGLAAGILLVFSDGPISQTQRDLSDILIAGSYLYSILDAPISSEDINGEIQRKCREGKAAWGLDFKLQKTASNNLAPMGELVLEL